MYIHDSSLRLRTFLKFQRLFAHFLARPPQILLAIWTYILVTDLFRQAGIPFTIQDACRISPSRTYLENAVTYLATDQIMCASKEMEQAEAVYLQCDGGQDGAFVKIFSWFSKATGKIKNFVLDVDKAGKKTDEIALGIKHSIKKLGLAEEWRLKGTTSDSGGGGTIEPLAYHLFEADVVDVDCLVASCTIHNLMTSLTNPVTNLLGVGGLSERTTLQACHTIYDLQKHYGLATFAKFAKKGWDNLYPGIPFPEVMGKTLQEPVMTRWWTVAVASDILSLYWDFFAHIAGAVVSMTRTDQADNKIASGLDSLLREDMIYSDTCLLADFHKDFLNSHLRFYQATDPETALPGYMIRHIYARYFVMKKQLKSLKSGNTGDSFERFFLSLDELQDDPGLDKQAQGSSAADEDEQVESAQVSSPSSAANDSATAGRENDEAANRIKMTKEQKQEFQGNKMKTFLESAESFIDKHNKRYCSPLFSVVAAFCEAPLGSIIAKHLTGRLDVSTITGTYFSEFHDFAFDSNSFALFALQLLPNAVELEELREKAFYKTLEPALKTIARGQDIWDMNDELCEPFRKLARERLLPLASSNHRTERFVKRSKYCGMTGRGDRMRSIWAIAANEFLECAMEGEEEMQRDSSGRVKGVWRGPERTQQIFNVVSQLHAQHEDFEAESPEAYNKRRREVQQYLKEPEMQYSMEQQTRLVEVFEEHLLKEKELNARQREQGYFLAPCMLGLVRFSDLRAALHDSSLKLELANRGVDFSNTNNFTSRRELLKADEKKRCEESKGLFDKWQLNKRHIDKHGRPKFFKRLSTNESISFPTSEPVVLDILFSRDFAVEAGSVNA